MYSIAVLNGIQKHIWPHRLPEKWLKTCSTHFMNETAGAKRLPGSREMTRARKQQMFGPSSCASELAWLCSATFKRCPLPLSRHPPQPSSSLFPPEQGDRIGRLRPLRCRMIPRATRPILKTSSKQTLGYRLAFQI